MKKNFSYLIGAFVGGELAAIVAAFVLPLVHVYTGIYSDVLDGLMTEITARYFIGYALFSVFSATFITVPVFYIVFLLIRTLTNRVASNRTLTLFAGTSTLIWISVADMNFTHDTKNLFLGIGILLLPPVALNGIMFALGRDATMDHQK